MKRRTLAIKGEEKNKVKQGQAKKKIEIRKKKTHNDKSHFLSYIQLT